jgi:hypothetical protein
MIMCMALRCPSTPLTLALPSNLQTQTTADMPDEFFYYHASATLTGPNGIDVLYEQAVEGAYINGLVVKGDEMVFQRTRLRVNCPTANPPPGKR